MEFHANTLGLVRSHVREVHVPSVGKSNKHPYILRHLSEQQVGLSLTNYKPQGLGVFAELTMCFQEEYPRYRPYVGVPADYFR